MGPQRLSRGAKTGPTSRAQRKKRQLAQARARQPLGSLPIFLTQLAHRLLARIPLTTFGEAFCAVLAVKHRSQYISWWPMVIPPISILLVYLSSCFMSRFER